MAEQALFHTTIITTGHGSKTKLFPASRQTDVIHHFQTNSDKVVVKSSEWLPVKVRISCGIFFWVNNTFEIHEQDYGYEYLYNQFRPQCESELNDYHGD